METVWYCLIALMLTVYVVLDGFDIGAGAIHLLVAKSDRERRLVLRSIGPFWDGNEVWLLAAGGTLYCAFPALYAAGFSGFYLPLMIVLWLLILRGIAIEFRNHIESPVWTPLWDGVFGLSSALLGLFFGAALGNVVRGVPLDKDGWFFEPLWADFNVAGQTGILDWYTLLVGAAAVATLTLHGALWVTLKTEGDLRQRASRLAQQAWWGVAALTVIVTAATMNVQPQVLANLSAHPWGYLFPGLTLAGLLGMRVFLVRMNSSEIVPSVPLRGKQRTAPDAAEMLRLEWRSFLSSCAYITGMMTSVVFGLYPYVLPASTNPAYALTVHNARAGDYGLRVALVWWVIGMGLAAGYFVFTYRHFAGKVKSGEVQEGY